LLNAEVHSVRDDPAGYIFECVLNGDSGYPITQGAGEQSTQVGYRINSTVANIMGRESLDGR
jgi:hypothetical protein